MGKTVKLVKRRSAIESYKLEQSVLTPEQDSTAVT